MSMGPRTCPHCGIQTNEDRSVRMNTGDDTCVNADQCRVRVLEVINSVLLEALVMIQRHSFLDGDGGYQINWTDKEQDVIAAAIAKAEGK